MIMYCFGCKKTHGDIFWKYAPVEFEDKKGKLREEYKHLCSKWAQPTQRPFNKRVSDYSPEEVMAGVPFGNTLKGSGFKEESKEDWGTEHKRGVKELKKILK